MSKTEQQTEINNVQIPKGHEKYNEANKDQCPFYSTLKKQEQEVEQKKDTQIKKKMEGCPIFIEDEKKNPPLDTKIENNFSLKYQSPFEIFLENKGILSLQQDPTQKYTNFSRKIFETYPHYLKHTLFHDDENMKKAQKLECSQRFFIYDVYKERGNQEFYKLNFEIALMYYERTLAVFKWLEFHEIQQENVQTQEVVEESKQEDNEEFKQISSDEMLRAKDIVENFKKQKQNKPQIIQNYNDSNVILRDGQEVLDTQEQSVRNQKIQESYILIAITYMKLLNFKDAQNALKEALKISGKYSQLYFRMSQAISYDKFSCFQELLYAKQCIEKALEMKKTEQIYLVQPHISKLLNLQNHEESYQGQLIHAKSRMEQAKSQEIQRITSVLQRVSDKEKLRHQLIKAGRVPLQSENNNQFSVKEEDYRENMEQEIILLMEQKYYSSLLYYKENKQQEKIYPVKMELQYLYKTVHIMNFYTSLDFESESQILTQANSTVNLDLTDQRIQQVLKSVQRQFAKEEFEKTNFNQQVYMFCLEQYIGDKEKEKLKNEKFEQKQQEGQKSKGWILSLFSFEGLVFLIVGMILYLTFLCHYSESSPIQEVLFAMKQYHQKYYGHKK